MTVRGTIRRDETILRLGGNGGPWRLTWGADDRQYVSVSDGYGPTNARGPRYNSRLYTLADNPSNARFGDLPGYPEPQLWKECRLEYRRLA